MMENADALDEVATPVVLSMPQQENGNEDASSATSYNHKSGDAVGTPRDTEVPDEPRPRSYGRATLVSSFGSFPHPGSLLGPFFSLGRLGKGTFCSIHKCISLLPEEPRLVAAKVELASFMNSGVLEGEATMLQHLHTELPPRTVPKYLGHFKSDQAAAIVMQYLPGNDMHHLRETAGRRRLALQDAVYLTADVILPLLRNMHDIGVVHRDVKPSNCVRYNENQFCMVDFGLSKSILVPYDSQYADPEHVWEPKKQTEGGQQIKLCLRKEREKADFRGTSMYASVRVHQLRDYSRRDDMWSLLYVFCDLVSGGLPWMSYAAARDRDACQKLKEQIHGLTGDDAKDETEKMIMGDEYHVAKYKRDMAVEAGKKNLPDVPEPLKMSSDATKVELLRTAFAHVAQLNFADEPDYELLQRCLHGFLDSPVDEADALPSIDWAQVASPESTESSIGKKHKRSSDWKDGVPSWRLVEVKPFTVDDDALWEEAERELIETANMPPATPLYGDAADMARLPLELQFRFAQMEYDAKNSSTVPHHVALNDWMQCALPLVYGRWDSPTYEPGGHRTNSDSYRRDVYLKLLEKCIKCASKFGYFRSRSCFYEIDSTPELDNEGHPTKKRRRISFSMDETSSTTSGGEMMAVSSVLQGLRDAKITESKKNSAPPPVLSFGTVVF